MPKHLRDFDDVDVDDSGSTTPKKATSKNLASPIKVQYTPKLKTRKVVVQTKKNKKGIITGLDEKTQHPFVSWGVRAFLRGQSTLFSSRSCLLMLMNLNILHQIQHHSLKTKKL